VLRFIDVIRWIMIVTVPILPTLVLGRHLFANNTHENPVRSFVAHTGSPKGEQKAGHTERNGFHRRCCFWFRN